MLETFMARIKQPDRQKAFWTLLIAKLLGVVALVLLIKGISFYFSTPALADDAAAAPPAYVNPLNTLWVLVASFLVFFMQAGFMALEAGFARSRETVNILMSCVFDTCICGILYWAIGFAFQFGTGNGFIGHTFFFLHDMTPAYGSTTVGFLAFFLFQFAFADTCSTITSGAMVGRTAFGGDLLYSTAVSGFIYPIVGHWIWGPDGWLATMSTPSAAATSSSRRSRSSASRKHRRAS